jgi:hypothetical protein
MSLPATADSDVWAVLGVAATTLLGAGWLARREHAMSGAIVAECADGSVIGVWRERVRRRPGRTAAQRARAAEWFPNIDSPSLRELVTDDLTVGDLCLARVRLGAGSEAWWVVDGLSAKRERVRVRWGFEDVASAQAVLAALQRHIVRAPVDEHGAPVAVSEAELDALDVLEARGDARESGSGGS